MSDHFGTENHMVIEDDYKSRTPKLSFDMRRGYAIPMIVDVTDEEIEGMRVQELRRNQDIEIAMRAVQNQVDAMRRFPINGNRK